MKRLVQYMSICFYYIKCRMWRENLWISLNRRIFGTGPGGIEISLRSSWILPQHSALIFCQYQFHRQKLCFFCIGVKIYYFSKKGPHCWFNMKICNIGRKLILIWSQLQMSMFLGTPKSDYVIYFWPFECAHYLNDTIRKISLQGPNLLLFSGYLEISIIITVNTNMIIIINTNLKCLL